MTTTLYNWQIPSKNRIVEAFRKGLPGFLDSSGTGTGKTLVACSAVAELQRPALVICPKAVKSAWRRWAEELGAAQYLVDVVNPERIVTEKTPYWRESRWSLPERTMAIVDEYHRGASGRDSKLTKAVAMLKAYKIPVLALSATAANSPLNMRALGFLLNQHSFGESSFFDWCLRNGCVRGYNNRIEFPKGPRGEAAMAELHKKLEPYTTCIRVSDVPDFPSTTIQARLIDLSEKATCEINEAYASGLSDMIKHRHVPDPLVYLLRARQKAEFMKIPYLVDEINDLTEEGNSVVVFLSFRETIRVLMSALTQPHVAIYGRNDDPDGLKRDADIAAFQRDEAVVCVAQIGAGGVGVSLHAMGDARPRQSLITPSFNAPEVKQALGRIHRANGKPSIQTFVLAAGTIEERVYNAVQSKLRCIDALNGEDLMGGVNATAP